MKHRPWNPTRRNRNIGTEKSGHSQNNRLVVPDRWADYRIYWERLISPVFHPFSVKGHELTLAVEPPKEGYIHASTPQDVVRVLELIDQEHLEEIDLIVFRQPKKKEEILKPVWGRFVYYADLGRYSGPAIYLEAVRVGGAIKWGNKLDPYQAKELDALEVDGHMIRKEKRGYEIITTPSSVRSTQLYRTLPHEIGHAVDYLYNSFELSMAAKTEAEGEYISEVFRSKPSLDKEEFAHRYAREFFEKWSAKGLLPFDQEHHERDLASMGFDPKWFYVEGTTPSESTP